MTDWDEQLAYFLILTQLLNEADLQLEADADAPAALIYAEELDRLRAALGCALDAATSIVDLVQVQRTAMGVQALKTPLDGVRVTH